MRTEPPQRSRRDDELVRRSEPLLLVPLALFLGGLLFVGCRPAVTKGGGSTPVLSSVWDPVIGAVASIVLTGILTMGAVAINTLKPHHWKRLPEGSPGARKLAGFIERRAEISTALEFGGQIAGIGLVFSGLLLTLFLVGGGKLESLDVNDIGPIAASSLVVAIPLWFTNLFFGDLVPRAFGTAHPVAVAARLGGIIRLTVFVLGPFARVVVGATEGLRRAILPKSDAADAAQEKEEEIRTLVESAEESGAIESDEKELITSVFEFTDTVAREVMTPRTDLDAVPVDTDPKELVDMIQRTGHSRIPLYEGTDDAIVGIVHAKDLLLAMVNYKPVTLRNLMRPAIFVTETKSLHDLLRDMRTSRSQLAVVQDEFGGTAGIVTIEDIIEELVGEIQDEYDEEEPSVNETSGGYLVDGKTHIDDVNGEIGSRFMSEDFDTIGGYVFGAFGRQPKAGEKIDAEGFCFTVAETDGKRILRLRIEPCETSTFTDGSQR